MSAMATERGMSGDEFLGRIAATFGEDYAAELLGRMQPDRGAARQALWPCEDGWIVGYTTERIKGGPHDGKFVVLGYRPVGKGSRSGKADEAVLTYERAFSTRRAARRRADALYRKHSPKWDAKHPERES